ncbi:MAG TPA: NAD+ synthase, partial [Porticoccaceae bacterium]|nr:NAD+ synthase [Porticoccaceae bacterium]
MSEKTLRIAAAQFNPIVGDVGGNTRRIIDWIGQARDKLKADLIVFPELTLTGYPPEDLLLRPDIYEMADQALSKIAGHTHGIVAVVGAPAREAGQTYNAAYVLSDGKIQARYDKQQLPNYGVFDELRYFQAGTQPLVIEVKGV